MTFTLPAVFRLHRGPLFWPVFAFGLCVFALSRWLPGVNGSAGTDEARFLDQAYVQVLRDQPGTYGVLEGVPQTFGARVLPRVLLAGVSTFTGDIERAGLWLSLAGLVAALAGMYWLCLSVFPFRAFAVATVAAFAGLGAVQAGLSPDPSIALGMALVVWGVASFFSSLEKVMPERVFLSGFLIGLAGYVQIELSLIWVLLALYLISQTFYNSPAKARGVPLTGMAFGGLLMVLAVLWPMIDRNLFLAQSPILPGYDAQLLLGAPAASRAAGDLDLINRFLTGFRMLAADAGALGIFAGLLWPLGIVLCTVLNRHKALPFFWVPFMVLWVVVLTVMSPVTGMTSFETCLRITTPLLIPFAVLVLVYPLFHWFQSHEAPPGRLALGGAGLTAVAFGMAVLPRIAGGAAAEPGERVRGMDVVIRLFEENADLRNDPLLTDRPGLFLGHGKQQVHGMNGETDWSIMLAKTADGSIQADALLGYLRQHNIRTIHLARHDDPLLDRLADLPDFQGGELMTVAPPHRVYRLHDFEPL
ncbi:MAG: hypothetical protein JJU05_18590 [Verrucomicrobia bacterium]|nr:hypothetical protein [Verrucomicrobiota bacterium]MCH8529107.1 hypothetical protein [Kiritimatiellia bacterium]